MWLQHNASPAQAGPSASGPQTEKLGSHRPPDGFVVSPFALVAPLRLVGGPRRGSFSILNLFLLRSPSPLPPLLFFSLHFPPTFTHSSFPLSLSFIFLSCESVFVRDKWKQGRGKWERGEKKKTARLLATHLDPSMSLSLSSLFFKFFFVYNVHFVFILLYSLPKKRPGLSRHWLGSQ